MSFNRVTFGPLAAPQPSSPTPSAPSLISTGLQVGQTPAATSDPLVDQHSGNQVQVQAGKRSATVNMAGQVTQHGTVSVQMATVPNGEEGILATANRGGTPKAAHELRPDDLIDIGGHSTTVANAERLGFLTRDKVTGLLCDNTANLAAAEAEKAEAEQKAEAEKAADPHYGQALPVEGATEALGDLVRSTTAGSQVRALLDVIDSGEVSRNALASLASESSTEPEAVAAKVATVIEGFKAQVASLGASHGVTDLKDFGSWARELGHAGALKQAMLQHGQQRSTAAYVPLMRSYMENLDKRNPDAILKANFPNEGVSAYRNQAGEIVLRTPNGEVSWRVAVRTGLVKPHRS